MGSLDPACTCAYIGRGIARGRPRKSSRNKHPHSNLNVTIIAVLIEHASVALARAAQRHRARRGAELVVEARCVLQSQCTAHRGSCRAHTTLFPAPIAPHSLVSTDTRTCAPRHSLSVLLEVPFTATHDQVIGRARGRWVFVDPGAQPGTAAAAPRQRARRTLAGSAAALPGSAAALPGWDPTFDVPKELQHNKNNKSQILGLANGPHLEEWKIMALRTTNQARAA